LYGAVSGAAGGALSGLGVGSWLGNPYTAAGGAVVGGTYGTIAGAVGGGLSEYSEQLDDYQDAVEYWCNNADASHEDYEETCEGSGSGGDNIR